MSISREVVIAKAKASDAQNILDYLNQVGAESDNLLFGGGEMTMSVEEEERYIEATNGQKNSAIFVGKLAKEIVCIGSISSSQRARIAHRAEFALSVKKAYWGKGIGSLLMDKMIEFCKENGCTTMVSLGVKAENENAIKLYKKFGFEVVGRHKNYFNIAGKYYDDVLMDLHL